MFPDYTISPSTELPRIELGVSDRRSDVLPLHHSSSVDTPISTERSVSTEFLQTSPRFLCSFQHDRVVPYDTTAPQSRPRRRYRFRHITGPTLDATNQHNPHVLSTGDAGSRIRAVLRYCPARQDSTRYSRSSTVSHCR